MKERPTTNNSPLSLTFFLFFFNDTATTEIYTLSLHDALPICRWRPPSERPSLCPLARKCGQAKDPLADRFPRTPQILFSSASSRIGFRARAAKRVRSEEHTSELQSRSDLVCRLLLEIRRAHV